MPSSSIRKCEIALSQLPQLTARPEVEEDKVRTRPLALNAHCEICIATAMWHL